MPGRSRSRADNSEALRVVRASHLGMAFDPRVIDVVSGALLRAGDVSAVEVDRGESA